MTEAIISGWWKVLALMAGMGAFVWVVVLAINHTLAGARKANVDELEIGKVKIDFNDDEKN